MSARDTTAHAWGSGEDWGLSRGKLAELRAELEDHLHCLAADEGRQSAAAQRESLQAAGSRRKLAAPHLVDQVYATLNRWPTRREWRELLFLLACFAVIVLSDWLAIEVWQAFGALDRQYNWVRDLAVPTPMPLAVLCFGAWLLMAAGRAAFFAGFAYTLWRAWRVGTGVLLARILQLKLIHTVLVVTSLLILGRAFYLVEFHGYGHVASWPLWLTAPVLLALCAFLALGLTILTRMRTWAFALGVLLLGAFLYSGGPLPVRVNRVTQAIAYESVKQPGGEVIFVPSDSVSDVAERAAYYSRWRPDATCDVSANKVVYPDYELVSLPGAYTERGRMEPVSAEAAARQARKQGRTVAPTGKLIVAAPEVAPGGGTGWLSLPIPFLGVIGLVGLVLIMGRRGPLEFLAYTAICVLAIIATIMPFFFGQPISRLVELSPLAMLHTPLPGFEALLTYYTIDWDWLTLVGGLVLSAGVPWLLTGLFLRPKQVELPPTDVELAE